MIIIAWNAALLGFMIGFVLRGHLEMRRCPRHNSLFSSENDAERREWLEQFVEEESAEVNDTDKEKQ